MDPSNSLVFEPKVLPKVQFLKVLAKIQHVNRGCSQQFDFLKAFASMCQSQDNDSLTKLPHSVRGGSGHTDPDGVNERCEPCKSVLPP